MSVNNNNKLGKMIPSHLFLLICSISLTALAIWSYVGHIDIVTVAQGVVIPSSKIKNVQHLEGGIIREINFSEGERVKKGSPLIVLEGTASSSNLEEIDIRLVTLRVDLARLTAELNNHKVIKFETDLINNFYDLTSASIEHFNTRKNHLNNLISSQQQYVTQRTEEVKEIQERIKKLKKGLKLTEEQIIISNNLLKENLTNRMAHLKLLKESVFLDGELKESKSSLNRVMAAKEESKLKILTLRDNFLADTRIKFDETDSLYRELSQRRIKLRDNLKRTVLRSPVDGVIKSLYHSTIGGIVKPGGTVVDIVPDGDQLLIEAQLPVHEIIYVTLGQTTKVRPLTPDAVSFGQIDGRVVHISPDSIRNRNMAPYYLITIELDDDVFKSKGSVYPLLPGIQVTCSIRTGERSILEYLLGPFMSIPSTAMHER